jgi:hypothetical protein
MERRLVSYKLPIALHRALRQAAAKGEHDMTAIVEQAVTDWLRAHRWLPGGVRGSDPIDTTARTRALTAIDRIARRSKRLRERHPGRTHDQVLYGSDP